MNSWLARQVEKADEDPAARDKDAPIRFEDLEDVEIPVQEAQSQSTPNPKHLGCMVEKKVMIIAVPDLHATELTKGPLHHLHETLMRYLWVKMREWQTMQPRTQSPIAPQTQMKTSSCCSRS